MSFANTPKPPYYVVSFSSQFSKTLDGYDEMADAMVALAQKQDGYLGVEAARSKDGFGITNSFWRDEESITKWRENARHMLAQKQGRERWYSNFFTRVAKVERDHFSNS